MKFLLIIAAMLALCSCASLTGNGSYKYESIGVGGESCSLNVDSGRVLENGIEVTIKKDCSIKVKAGSATQGRSSVSELTELINLLRAPVTPGTGDGS